MMTIYQKIEKVTEKLKQLCGDSTEKQEWLKAVIKKGAAMSSEKEELNYLEGQLQALRSSDKAEPQEPKKIRLNPWRKILLFSVLAIITIAIIVTGLNFLSPRNANAASNNSSTSTISSTISQNLPKEEFQVIDYKVDGNTVVYDSQIENTQHKVFANGSEANSLSADSNSAVNEMIQYMSHNATALKEKAMAFGIVDTKADAKDWLEKGKDGKVYYSKKGKDVFYQTKAFLSRSKISSKKMEEGSNYYATGVDAKGNVVVSKDSQDLSGQEYVEVSNPKGSTEKYSYRVLVYCGNTVMQSNAIPGVKTGKVEIPTKPDKPGKPSEPGKPNKPGKPGKPSEPSKPSESKVEKKAPGKDPANQGKALVGGGQNDGSLNGTETTQASLPEQYSAPSAPVAPSAPAQDARISEPSQWSGAGKVTDSNGTTVVADNGAVTTPDNRHYDGLVGQSAPSVKSGGNGVTTPSSSANFSGSSMSEPGIDD